jgi:hypothetical protein
MIVFDSTMTTAGADYDQPPERRVAAMDNHVHGPVEETIRGRDDCLE